MAIDQAEPIIAFVWKPGNTLASVIDLASATRTTAIIDLSSMSTEHVRCELEKASTWPGSADVKISQANLLELSSDGLLYNPAIGRVWIELNSTLTAPDGMEQLMGRIVELSPRINIIPVVSHVEPAVKILRNCPTIRCIGLKGNEAAGFVGTETIFTLFASVRSLLSGSGTSCELCIWGGVALPEAAAAFLCAGASGIVFESLHWLTNLQAVDDTMRRKITGLRPEYTEIVGWNLGVPCRLFNKGNSAAVKELKKFAGTLCGSEITEEQRSIFSNRISGSLVHPFESEFGRDELIPLGVEASFAASFAARYGVASAEAIGKFVVAIADCCNRSARTWKAFLDSPVPREMGTAYPFIQGAMTWITDVPEFSRTVADAGGLPTIALGLMSKDILEQKLAGLPEIMEGLAFAVNVITLPENPFRDDQLTWIKTIKPRFAVIAAGDPSHAAELISRGIEVIYIAPSEDLLKLAFAAGVKYIICEGNEAGGHVGTLSLLTLAQSVLRLKAENPDVFQGRRVVLAGGIFNRETAFMAAMLGADAIQMGTAYLATTEIVTTGALSSIYQRTVLDARPEETTITGESTGLRVRSLKTPKIDSLCKMEREFGAGSEDESSFRQRIEAMSAGSLFVAARGMDQPGGHVLEETACLEHGQFMSGASAGVIRSVVSVKELHAELAVGAPEHSPFLSGLNERLSRRSIVHDISSGRETRHERIAITAMSVANALGNDRDVILRRCLALQSGIRTVPASNWDHSIFYDPKPRTPDKTYCTVGAFLDINISRKELGIPPQDFRTMTGATKITMWLAKQAIQESRILDSDIPPERIAVIISQNSGEAAGTLQDMILRGSTNKIIESLRGVLNLTKDDERAVEQAVKSGRLAVDDTTLLGRLNCSAGGFICNKYGFMGPSFSVSAACATSLVALYSAIQMMRNGIIDAAVVGGGEEFLSPMHFMEFSALGALAGLSGVQRPPTEMSRPFDADRDGMVLGEGGGMIVIEKESVARERGVPIHAFITAMGASNNHLGMVESSRQTQEIAIRSSFRETLYGPSGVDLIECHATATRQGDGEEVNALRTFFDGERTTVLSSFKSQIGHTLGASGINSLIRGIGAMNSGVFPPTLNYDTPDPQIGIESSRFVVPREPLDWPNANGRPRRLQVNAFGFGGSNYVVQIEEATDSMDTILVEKVSAESKPWHSPETPPLPDGIFFFHARIGDESYRLAVLAEDEQAAVDAVDVTEALKNGGPIPAKRLRSLARQGVHLGPATGPEMPLAFVFPGQGSHYAGMGHELYKSFPPIRKWMDKAAEFADFDLLHLLFFDREEDLQKTRWQQPALFTLEYAMVQYLIEMGIRPMALAGHSLGELTALCLAGVYSFEDGFRIVNKRAICMDKACHLSVDPGIMLACDAPMDVLTEMMTGASDIYVTNVNSPRQVVIGGGTDDVKSFGTELKKRGFRNTVLRVSMAFHSPIMRCIHDELEEFISSVEFRSPQIPVISNTTMKPFPDDPSEIKRIVMAHLESPVRWMDNVRSLWDDYGVRLFVEVGPREILSNLISDTIESADCIQTCLPSAEAAIYRTAVAQLYARCHVEPSEEPTSLGLKDDSGKLEVRASSAAPIVASGPPLTTRPTSLESIVQREINSFVMESFGKFIKPNIRESIRATLGRQFTEDDLDQLLEKMTCSVERTVELRPATPIVRAEPVPRASGVIDAASREVLDKLIAGQTRTSEEDITEKIIQLIMEATGYERDEIEPDMDLREDLSIRSSRLPVIMDSLESHFGIKIELEDFIGVRTIRDISERISAIIGADGVENHPKRPGEQIASEARAEGSASDAGEQRPIHRVVFRETPMEPGSTQPVELKPTEPVVILSAKGGTGLRRRVGDVFRRDYGAEIVLWSFLKDVDENSPTLFDFRMREDASEARNAFRQMEAPAGLVFIIDEICATELKGAEEIPRILEGFFLILKAFTESRGKKFAILLHKTESRGGLGDVLAEGVIGMFLTAALEYGYVQFRSASISNDTNLSDVIRGALDRSRKELQTIYRANEPYTVEGRVEPLAVDFSKTLDVGPDDVVVFSGGGYGVTHQLARGLLPYRSRMVFLGRTPLEPEPDIRKLAAKDILSIQAARDYVDRSRSKLSDEKRASLVNRITRAIDIVRNLEKLTAQGADVTYFCCDVTDRGRTRDVIESVFQIYGRIDGVIHGAGVIKDSFIGQMDLDQFSPVVDVKFLGALNLFEAASDKGLRFYASLSSGAALQGNPGQINYTAGNRMMSALMSHLNLAFESVVFKALHLPPIEGIGMAEDPEIQALMKRMNVGYIHPDELSQLFWRELTLGSHSDVWGLFMRALPQVNTVRLRSTSPPEDETRLSAGAVSFDRADFPMIDVVTALDLLQGRMEANRTFSDHKDLWLNDHKPFSFLRHPLVSAVMALETCMEASRILYPHLEVCAVRDAWFLDIIECPSNSGQSVHVDSRKVERSGAIITCQASISLTEAAYPHYKALVLLSGNRFSSEYQDVKFEPIPHDLETMAIENIHIQEQYMERSQMQARYRVIDSIVGTSPGVIRGLMVYRAGHDFSGLPNARFNYSPYVLEALLQLANFYWIARNPSETRAMIPYKIGEAIFFRNCVDGEHVTLEGRLKHQDDEGIIWDARGLDERGDEVMAARGIVFRWFSM